MRSQLPPVNFLSRLTLILVPILFGLILANLALFFYLRSQFSAPSAPPPSPSPVISPVSTLVPQMSPSPTLAPTLAPSSTPLVKIPLVSTAGWHWVRQNGVKFLLPPDFSCESTTQAPSTDNNCRLIQPPGTSLSRWVEVEPYLGGSRRTQFLGDHPEDSKICRYRYVDSLFGTVPALQIANDGGQCQGGGGGIVAVVGDKLVTFHELNYNSETNQISRWPVGDTIISTLTPDF